VSHKLVRFAFLSACVTVISMFTMTAAPCSPGTLASYISLGSVGCTIGGDTFFNFQLLPPTGTASGPGAVPIPASAIDVSGLGPLGTSGASGAAPFLGSDIGVDFDAVWAATAGQTLDDNISFDVSVGPGAASITDAGIVQDSYTTGDGSVTVAEKGCSGICTPSTEWGVATNDTSFVSDQIFTATGTISVEKDIAVDGGSGDSSAGLSNVADVFSTSEVPEPRALSLLLGLGLVAGFAFRKKFQSDRA
jgi:hypothetical protein